MADVFDVSNPHYDEVRSLLTEDEWSAARRTTLNAHYTSHAVVAAMWDAVTRLGFDGGEVLEPGCGSGNFIGQAPEGARVTGVELDPTTARIAEHLYGPRATILPSSFEKAPLAGAFDLVIGNVPFADVVPSDRVHNAQRHRLHNYFIVKSLHLAKPGALVAVLTSRYTLDSRNLSARRDMAALADLIGAVRLPAGAFAASAGTDVIADILILRRRPPGASASIDDWTWLTTSPMSADASGVPANELFVTRPELVVGTLTTGRGMYRDHDVTVEPPEDLDASLGHALDVVVDRAHRVGLTHAPATTASAPTPLSGRGGGSFEVEGAGFARLHGAERTPYAPRVRGDTAELRRLIELRDAARDVLDAQLDGVTDPVLDDLQRVLVSRYDHYRQAHGPLNRYTLARTGRADPNSGEDQTRRMRPRMGGFRDDPDWPLVASVEVFDDETQAATKAAIFTVRIIAPPKHRDTVETPADAIAVCLDERGEIQIERVAELLGDDPDTVRPRLDGLVYDDPTTGAVVPAARYLSGNVRAKLAAAHEATTRSARFEPNVTALAAALPPQLTPGEITARLGAPWIPAPDVETFCGEVLDAGVEIEFLPSTGRWTLALRAGRRASVALSSEWGTGRADAVALLDASLNQRRHTVTDESEDGRRVRNDAETVAARQKQDELADRFGEWLWEDPARAVRLADRYNELFCSVSIATPDGSHLSLPGLSESFEPRPHQRDAVARTLVDGRVLLAHAVGAGKTATMVMSAMELRRLQLASKPAVVVPNHMLEQFTREWLQLYPGAQLLIADKDRLTADRRREFVARCATGDWDGILFTHSGFGRLPLQPATIAGYVGTELDRVRQALVESTNGKGLSIKKLEKRVAQLEESYDRLLNEDRKDDGICFEETGIDYLFLDEAHLYKNRRVDSAIEGMAHPGSQRAQDLDAKLWSLRRQHGPRIVTFATATPVANSMAELWVMQSYLQPDVLEAAGVAAFDGWAATFGRTTTTLELAPDGASYRLQTRFARFQNVPELMTLYRQVADVRTAAELDLPTPAVVGDAPETVVVPASDALRTYVSELADRAERVRNRSVTPAEDNMLKITGDGRRAALDLRLIGLDATERGKIESAADRIAGIHHRHADATFTDETGATHARRGALQLIFCDVSTPSGSGWNAYDELRSQLAARRVPAALVRFVHEASTDADKAKLFEACRSGRVAVLIGSTEKMGIGTNVQARAAALHHLDCPWRPADIEQREGRILRQGNQNSEVEICRYVTEGSFDTYMWQTLERKAAFIAQVSRGDLSERDVDDIGDQALSFAEVKALATGNPLILEKAAVDNDVARLRRLERAHRDDQHRLQRTLEAARSRVARTDMRIDVLDAAAARRVPTEGDRFLMQCEGAHHDRRVDAGSALIDQLRSRLGSHAADATIGALGGLDLHASVVRGAWDEITVRVGDIASFAYTEGELVRSDPVGIVRRLEHALNSVDDALMTATTDRTDAQREVERALARLGRPFEGADELHRAEQRQRELDELLLEPVAIGSTVGRPGGSAAGISL